MKSPIRPIQPTFSSGEVSPEIYARTDINRYKTALKKLRNMIVHPTGGISNRPGTRFVAEAKHSDKLCIVQEFVFSSDDKYVLEFGEEYIRFYTNGAQVQLATGDVYNFDPTEDYVEFDDYVKVGDYVPLDFGGGKMLYVAAVYGATTTGKTVEVTTSGSDLMTVTYSTSTQVITISLADTSSHKNSAIDIQYALQAANGAFTQYTVTESIEYANNRPITATIAATAFTACNKVYYCIENVNKTAGVSPSTSPSVSPSAS